MTNEIEKLHVLLYDMKAVENGTYPLHSETIGETITHNLRSIKDETLPRSWQIVGIFKTDTEALVAGKELAIHLGLIKD